MKKFEELGLQENLLQAIAELGFEVPMPIQEEVIPLILENETDVVGLAQTGTGKTAAFGLPVLQKLNPEDRSTQALILCPTRELCMQITDDLNEFARHMPRVHVLPVYGGSSIKNQIENLRKGVHIIVATPGRLMDLMRRGHVDLENVHNVVMDEADEMLNMGFLEDIETILGSVPEERNILLFSATMPKEVETIARRFVKEPKEVVIGRKNESNASVRHICYTVQAKEKYATLKRIIDFYPRIYGIIFCRTKIETQEIADKLIHDGYNVDSLHGDLSQPQRDYVMQRFRLHNIQLLVATDVAARGIDVDDLTHIINYTLPDETEVYTHRSGRTGRAGKTGISIAITNLRESKKVHGIEKTIGKTFETGKIPTGKEICAKQIFGLIDRLEKVEVNEDEIAELLPSVYRKLEWLDKEDLIKRIVSNEFNRLIDYYRDNEDFEATSDTRRERRVDVTREAGYTKLFITLGKMDGFGPKEMLGLINDCVGGKVDVGRIDLFTRYSLFDVAEASAKKVIDELGALNIHGRKIRISEATDEQISRGGKDRENRARLESSRGDRRQKGQRDQRDQRGQRGSNGFKNSKKSFHKDKRK
jgi:Superfamily II DNA and RNA helicases